MENQIKEWLEAVVKGMVGSPDEVTVVIKTDETGSLFTVRVAQPDIGFVIGREGSHVNALRILLRALGARYKLRAALLVDDGRKRHENTY